MTGGPDEPIIPPLDERAGPARRVSQQRIAAMVSLAFDAVDSDAAPDAEPARAPRSGGRVLRLAGGIALGFAIAGAAAALWYGISTDEDEAAPTLEAPGPEPEVAPDEGVVQPVSEADPEAEHVEAPEIEPEEEHAPTKTVVVREPLEPPAPVEEVLEDLPPDDLLQRANALRGERRWADAERTYQQVIDRHPGSRQAYIATVAAAALRRDHLGDPARAVVLYQSALRDRPDGFLREEASYGLAQAYRATGDRRSELDALRRFVERHPDSLNRSRAAMRIEELGAAGDGDPGDEVVAPESEP